MPVLPGSDQSQVLIPGSPVPIASAEDARLPGDTLARFGAAVSALGDALDAAGRKAKDEHDKISVMNAENAYRMKLLERRSQQASAAPIAGDTTGFGAVKSVADDMQPVAAQIAQTLDTKDQQVKFLARAGEILNETSTTIWADEVKKRTENNKADLETFVSTSGQLARVATDPNDVSFLMKRAELAIQSSGDLMEAHKNIETQKANKSILIDAIQGRLVQRDYNGARLYLEQLGKGVFTPEEKAKQSDEITNTENKDATVDWTKLNRDEKLKEQEHKDTQQKLLNYFSTALEQAGNSDIKRAPILKDLELMKFAGKIDSSKADELSGSKVFPELQDDMKDRKIMTEAFKTGNFDAAINDVNSAANDGLLSNKRAAQMIDRLMAFKEHQSNDPIFKDRLRAGEALIQAQGSESIMEPLSSLAKKELKTKIEMTVQQFYAKISANRNTDPDALSRYLIHQNFGASTTIIKGNSDIFSTTSVQGLDALRKKTVQQSMYAEKQGLMTKGKKVEFQERLKAIQQRENELMMQNPPQMTPGGAQTEPQPGAGKTSAPVRGK